MSKEGLRAQIRELTRDLAVNGMNVSRMQRIGNVNEVIQLLLVRTEILKSIAHRQGLLIEALDNEAEYKETA
jgi:hypothetical protein